MKFFLFISAISIFFSSSCTKHPFLSLNDDGKKQIIAFQPLGDYNELEADAVIKEIAGFYNKPVIVLKPIPLPNHFFNSTLQQYSADSLISLLAKLQNDTIVEIVGLMHQPIFTIKERGEIPYFDENVFGMGYQPGNSCVISDNRFKTTYSIIFNHRLRNVILHEMGHNLGLPHCRDNKCIMSESNGDILTLDKSGNDYCAKCRRTLDH